MSPCAPYNTKLKGMGLREFTELMFKKCSSLQRYKGKVDEIYRKFQNYKWSVPTAGIIILNQKLDKCVMVKGYKSGSSWGFPKGKINKSEPEEVCGVREVMEEVGVDFTGFVKQEDSIIVNRAMGEGITQRTRLFIVPGIAEDTPFATQTRKEIGQIAWHPLTTLMKAEQEGAAKKYYFVKPFIQPLLKWVKNAKKDLKAKTTSKSSKKGGGSGGGVTLVKTHLDPSAVMAAVALPPPSPGSARVFSVAELEGEAEEAPRFPSFAGFKFQRKRVMACVKC